MSRGSDRRRERPRGRPPAPEPGSRVSAWIYVRQHDALAQLAYRRSVSVSSLVRTLITKGLADLQEN